MNPMLKFNKEAWIVFCLLAFVFGYFYQDAGWNGNSRIALSLAVVRESRLNIDSYQGNEALGLATGDRAFFNGHYYTDKAIGSSIVGGARYDLACYQRPFISGYDYLIYQPYQEGMSLCGGAATLLPHAT